MSMAYELASTGCDDRALSLAHRMVRGAAAASLFAYRVGVGIDLVAHGVAADGSIVVAAVPPGLLASVLPGFPIDVRVDLVKLSPDPAVSLVAASAHLLSTLTWAAEAEAQARVAAGDLPGMVEAMLLAPGARLGFLEIEKVVLHDMTGATVIPLEALELPGPLVTDGYSAFDAVAAHGPSALTDLCWAVLVGALPGIVTRRPPLPHICSHTVDRVFCVDVDPLGVTVMLVGRHETLTAYAPFGSPATTQSELEEQVSQLMGAAVPLRGRAAWTE